MIRRLTLALLVIALVSAACGDDDSGASTIAETAASSAVSGGTISTAEYQVFRSQPVACGGALPPSATEKVFTEPADLGLSGTLEAVVATSCGEVTIALDAEAAPATVNSFVFLAEQGYFDGTVSHRIVPGFVIQLGDPTATGRGGPGYRIPDELPAADFAYARGTVAMANAGPDSGGSQFFLVLDDISLPPNFSVFGTVTSGLDAMDRIAEIPTIARSAGLEPSSPTESLYIESISIDR